MTKAELQAALEKWEKRLANPAITDEDAKAEMRAKIAKMKSDLDAMQDKPAPAPKAAAKEAAAIETESKKKVKAAVKKVAKAPAAKKEAVRKAVTKVTKATKAVKAAVKAAPPKPSAPAATKKAAKKREDKAKRAYKKALGELQKLVASTEALKKQYGQYSEPALERDAKRGAKHPGWRLKGIGNYKRPTKQQIRDGDAYWEGRPQRSDVSRKGPIKLKKGGEVKSEAEKNQDKEIAKRYRGQGVDKKRDQELKAKPFGPRYRGKGNYKKPTKADIAAGETYTENRPSKADVRRKPFPKL
jgi:hypothetical protein